MNEDIMKMEELQAVIKDGISAFLPEFKAEVLKEIETIKNDGKNSISKAYDVASNFIKDTVAGVLKATPSTDGASFGNAVPTELAGFILEKRDKIAKMRKIAFVFSMSGKFQLPTEGTGVTSYWVAENADITASEPTLSKKTLDDHYLAGRVLIPRKLLQTSAYNLVNFISALGGRALAKAEEIAFVGGDGSGKPTGVRSGITTTIAQVGASMAYDDLVNLYYGLPEEWRDEAVFMTSSSGMKLLRKLKDENGLPIFDLRDQTIFGKQVIESSNIPSNLGVGTDETEILFFDPKQYYIKDGEQMQVLTSDINKSLQTEIVIFEAVDGVFVEAEAGVKLTAVK